MYTIVIPSIGRLQYLLELIKSIDEQTIECDEIIILVDQKFESENDLKKISVWKNTKIIITKEAPSAKRNHGIKIAQNNFIFLSDDDDIWHPKKAELVLMALKKYDVVCHNFNKFGLVNQIDCSKLGKNNKIVSKLNLLRGDNIFGGGSSIASNKKVFLENPFDSNLKYTDDLDWWIKIINNKNRLDIFYLGKSLVNYRSHNKNITKLLMKVSLENIYVGLKNIEFSFFSILVGSMIILKNIIKIAIYLLSIK